MKNFSIIFVFAIAALIITGTAENCCFLQDRIRNVFAQDTSTCALSAHKLHKSIYLLYDVNPSEGFNLRRDVYIRLAVLVRHLQQQNSRLNRLKLVLPYWRRLYHWKSSGLQQDFLAWDNFFDIESMRRYVTVLDFPEFLAEMQQIGLPEWPLVTVHSTLQLLHFKEMFENGVFRDRYEFLQDCPPDYKPYEHLFKQSQLLESKRTCVRFQGSANLLESMLLQALRKLTIPGGVAEPAVLAILNSEIVLHTHWGDNQFWLARRSMRFAKHLVDIADNFRYTHFNATNAVDLVQRPPMWEVESAYRRALGGPYLCAHLRRGDFVYGREQTTPSLKSAAIQIKQRLHKLNLSAVFLATDANVHELKDLKSNLQRVRVVTFSTESFKQKSYIKDGGVAIIDQLICANARYFIGTYESTFTYRIYEEREILGFSKDSTFNTFCKSDTHKNCLHNSVWPIVY